MLLKHEEVGKI